MEQDSVFRITRRKYDIEAGDASSLRNQECGFAAPTGVGKRPKASSWSDPGDSEDVAF